MTWEPNDLALCIKKDEWELFAGIPPKIGYPEYGKTYKVSEVILIGSRVFLTLKEFGKYECWLSDAFRKVKPDSEPCDEEFKELIKVKEPVV